MSGSGKSTLIIDTLYKLLAHHVYNVEVGDLQIRKVTGLEHIDKVIDIDQSPIGKTPRSNPATYTGLFSLIRDLFANYRIRRSAVLSRPLLIQRQRRPMRSLRRRRRKESRNALFAGCLRPVRRLQRP